MSLSEKVGQLIVAPICPTHGEEHLENIRKLLIEKEIGNVIFMSGTSELQQKIIQIIQNELDRPLYAFQDAEWGVGMRLSDVSNLPKNLTLGAIQDLELLRAFGLELARQCRLVGIAGDFAPVADVNSNPKNPIIHRRSFGADPDQVAERALMVMEGMRAGGIWACAKHFPGHGDTSVDSHHALPVIDKSLEEIERNELIPFKKLIHHEVDMVMVGHLVLPQISREPSSLSKEIITDLLRGKLGFEGVVVTDALNMEALSGDPEENAIKALLAGCDLLVYATAKSSVSQELIEKTIPKVIERIKAEIPEDLIDEKLERIQEMRERKQGTIPQENPQLRRTLYRHAVTCIGELPPMEEEVALVQSHSDPDFESYLSRYAEVKLFSYD